MRIPGIGKMVNGSWRWLQVGPMTIQPSEFAKPAFLIVMAGFRVVWALMNPLWSRDSIRIIGLLCSAYIGGAGLWDDFTNFSGWHLFNVNSRSSPGPRCSSRYYWHSEYFKIRAMGRIMAFLDPQTHEQGKAWQLVNSSSCFCKWRNVRRFGNSFQKYHYLPEAHTDFIFPIIGEEPGLISFLTCGELVCDFIFGW